MSDTWLAGGILGGALKDCDVEYWSLQRMALYSTVVRHGACESRRRRSTNAGIRIGSAIATAALGGAQEMKPKAATLHHASNVIITNAMTKPQQSVVYKGKVVISRSSLSAARLLRPGLRRCRGRGFT